MITGRALLTMPLHTITEVHGTPGLRARLDLVGADQVRDAADWATAIHAGQRRTREPYVNHVLRVALRIHGHYRVDDSEVLTAALLHDAVEDQPARVGGAGRPEAFAAITHRHGPRVARLVGAVTNPHRDPGADRVRHYVEHLATALEPEPWARVLKLSDFTDNAVGISYTIGPKAVRMARKYAPAVAVLRDLLHRPDTPLPPDVRAHIAGQLELADRRLAAVLA